MEVLLINNDDLTRHTILGGNIDIDKLVPAMKAAQKTMIKPLFSRELYDKLCLDFYNDNLTGDYFILWNEYLRDMLIYSAAEIYINTGAYTIANNGITKIAGEGAVTINKDELSGQVEFYRRLYDLTKRDMEEWLKTTDLVPKGSCKEKYIRVGGMLLKRPKNCK